jgi:aspartyl protease family protein
MDRPIIWALGILAGTAICAISLAPRLATFLDQPDSGATQATAKSVSRAGPRLFSIAADYRGHFTVHPTVRNMRLRMLVDTGASMVVLTDGDARSLGIKLRPADYRVSMSTANGIISAAQVHLDEVTLGEITIRRVEAVVMPAGALNTSLLGMSFLKRLSGFEIAAGKLILKS